MKNTLSTHIVQTRQSLQDSIFTYTPFHTHTYMNTCAIALQYPLVNHEAQKWGNAAALDIWGAVTTVPWSTPRDAGVVWVLWTPSLQRVSLVALSFNAVRAAFMIAPRAFHCR